MIKDYLQSQEKEQLSKFRLQFNKEINNIPIIEAADLVNENKLAAFLETAKEKMNAPDITVAASLFSKRYSYLVLVPALFAMSRYNKFLNIEIYNLEIIDSHADGIWMPNLYFKDQTILKANTEMERLDYLPQYFQKLFSQHLNLVWDALANTGGISKQILWENTAVYIFWLYETVLTELSDEKENEDFRFLLFGSDGSLFGNYVNNPLLKFYNNKIIKDDTEIRTRKTCCLSYKVSEKQMCKTCPKIC